MARTAGTKKTKIQPEEAPKKKSGFFDYLRFGESYTSLILGIIVVVIATALLLSFVHNKNAGNKNVTINEQTQNTVEVSQQQKELSNMPANRIVDNAISVTPIVTVKPTAIPTAMPKPTNKPVMKPNPTAKPKPTVKPIATTTSKPLAMIKPKAISKPEPVIKKIAITKHKAKQVRQSNPNKNKNVWIVQKGESLWTIAEQKYTSGYNWVDIARVNNLSNPGDIHAGDRLILPNVSPKAATISIAAVVTPTKTPKATHTSKSKTVAIINNRGNTGAIIGNTYTVAKGDNLWSIALRAYGDGYRWPDIARANNLADPRMIFSGNVLIIPR